MRKSVYSVSLLSIGVFLNCTMTSQALDIKPRQVFIEARIADIIDTDLEGFGIGVGGIWDADALNKNESLSKIGKWNYVASGGVENLDLANAFDASLGLRVTPEITSSDAITLSFGVGANIAAIEDYQVEDTIQDPYLRDVQTKVLVEERDSVILGGLYGEVVVESNKVPLLGDLPVVGRLFASAPVTDRQGEYLVFITVGILVGGE